MAVLLSSSRSRAQLSTQFCGCVGCGASQLMIWPFMAAKTCVERNRARTGNRYFFILLLPVRGGETELLALQRHRWSTVEGGCPVHATTFFRNVFQMKRQSPAHRQQIGFGGRVCRPPAQYENAPRLRRSRLAPRLGEPGEGQGAFQK